MGAKTHISWTDATWNPVTGCTQVSPGCDRCFAKSIAERFAGTKAYPNAFEVTLRPERLAQPLQWTRPRMVFVNSMSDLFHEAISDEFIAKVFAVMAAAPHHTFQVLTKRHGRMRSLLSDAAFQGMVAGQVLWLNDLAPKRPYLVGHLGRWPLPNVWVGVSVENQKWADIRIPALLETPAARRFLSCEPLLGPVDLTGSGTQQTYWLTGRPRWGAPEPGPVQLQPLEIGAAVDWVIAGGESGPGARPMHPEWVRSLRDQCATAGTAFHFKQWGAYMPTASAGDRPPTGWVRRDGSGLADQPVPDSRAVWRVGAKDAGNELDGAHWEQFPDPDPAADLEAAR